jgi:acetyl/propionyl-CoA carboxylase alpha subunit
MIETVSRPASPCYEMISSSQKVVSPCFGVIEEVIVDFSDYVYEWEPLFLIKTVVGNYETVRISVSGHITGLEVKKGDVVTPNMTLAWLKDDFIVSGSD